MSGERPGTSAFAIVRAVLPAYFSHLLCSFVPVKPAAGGQFAVSAESYTSQSKHFFQRWQTHREAAPTMKRKRTRIVFETLEARHLITQCQSPLLEPTQHQIIGFRRKLRTIDQGIQVRMLNTHVDQPPEIRMKVFVHETLAFGVAKITIDPAHNALD